MSLQEEGYLRVKCILVRKAIANSKFNSSRSIINSESNVFCPGWPRAHRDFHKTQQDFPVVTIWVPMGWGKTNTNQSPFLVSLIPNLHCKPTENVPLTTAIKQEFLIKVAFLRFWHLLKTTSLHFLTKANSLKCPRSAIDVYCSLVINMIVHANSMLAIPQKPW